MRRFPDSLLCLPSPYLFAMPQLLAPISLPHTHTLHFLLTLPPPPPSLLFIPFTFAFPGLAPSHLYLLLPHLLLWVVHTFAHTHMHLCLSLIFTHACLASSLAPVIFSIKISSLCLLCSCLLGFPRWLRSKTYILPYFAALLFPFASLGAPSLYFTFALVAFDPICTTHPTFAFCYTYLLLEHFVC